MKIENFDDLIIALGYIIEEALELDISLTPEDIEEAFQIALEECVDED
jgi:hypothetical protein